MSVEPIPLLNQGYVYQYLLRYAQLHQPHPRQISPRFPEIKVMFRADTDAWQIGCLYLLEPHNTWQLRLRPVARRIESGAVFRAEHMSLTKIPKDVFNPYGPDLDLDGDYVDLDAFAADLFSTFSGAVHG